MRMNVEYLIDKSCKKLGRKKVMMQCNRCEGKLIGSRRCGKVAF